MGLLNITDEDISTELDTAEESAPVEKQDQQDGEHSEKPEEEEEVIVTIGEEKPPEEKHEEAPAWVKEVRKRNRELEREIKELKKAKETAPDIPKLGPKPTLADADYDADRHEAALLAWHESKRRVEAAEAAAEAEKQAQQAALNKDIETYSDKARELKVRDFKDAEAEVSIALNNTQQGLILQGADNAALVVYALGKSPARLKELAAIKDPVKFIAAMAKMEAQMKVTKRKPTTVPEKTLSGVDKKTIPADKYDVGGTFE